MKHKADKRLLYPAAFVLMILLSVGYNMICKGSFLSKPGTSGITVNRSDAEETDIGETEAGDTTLEETRIKTISVYICGAVRDPGGYELHSGALLNDVVLMPGGMTSDAASEKVNLVYVLDSNISVYIPFAGEDEPEGGIYDVDPILIDADDTGLTGSDEDGASVGLVNINTADINELMTLPGIGEVTAEAIIEYRQADAFDDIRELMNVSGIGEGRFSRISGLICVN